MAATGGAPTPNEVADYIAQLAGELATLAQSAGLAQTAVHLRRAERSALADLRARLTAPDDAA